MVYRVTYYACERPFAKDAPLYRMGGSDFPTAKQAFNDARLWAGVGESTTVELVAPGK
jgi:hypothetical protein